MKKKNCFFKLFCFISACILILGSIQARADTRTNFRTVPTPSAPQWKFSNGSSVRFYLMDIPDQYKSYIRSGFLSWNGIANISVVETYTLSNADIIVETTPNYSSSAVGQSYHPNIDFTYQQRRIHFYTNNLSNYGYWAWRVTACHEMGHQLGLAHNSAPNPSAMKPSVDQAASSPQYADILTLQTLYP